MARQTTSPPKRYIVIGYVSGNGWAKDQIDARKLTHINYAFAVPAPNGELAPISPKDSTNLAILTSLRAVNKDLKILISVGGWGGCKYFCEPHQPRRSPTVLRLRQYHDV